MNTTKKHKLITIEWPHCGECEKPARPEAREFQKRIDSSRQAMEKMGLTHLIINEDNF